MNFPDVAAVEAMHARQISRYGGSPGLRDRGLLESAVARAKTTEYYRPEATVAEIAASLAWGLIKNHAFIDGNKRVGFAALISMLEANGYTISCTEEEETAATLKAAAGEFTEEQWGAWVSANVVDFR